jgi:hypothetical protein
MKKKFSAFVAQHWISIFLIGSYGSRDLCQMWKKILRIWSETQAQRLRTPGISIGFYSWIIFKLSFMLQSDES